MSDATFIRLPDRLDITSVEDVHKQLEDALVQGKPVVLEGDEVTRLDTAAMQMLASFRNEAEMNHLEMSWKNPSSTIKEVLNLMQFGPQVGFHDHEAGAVQ
ncbi:MAG: STAS domain-containing protein [Pseudomonadales bacterium]|nr:STAS domain-containing protein [Pseudomonadales bacterium]